MRIGAILPFALGLPSCVPFALPPARVEVGSVPADERGPILSREGEVNSSGAASGSVEGSNPTLFRAGVHPLQLLPKLAGRRVDVGTGYMIESGRQGDSAWEREGPYAEVGVYPFQAILGLGHRLRAGAVALGEYFLHDDRGYRAGVSASAAVELVGFTSRGFQLPNAVGMTYGEWGLGAFAGPGLRFGDHGEKWAGTFGVSARIPFTMGVVCCIDPTEHHGTGASRRNLSEPARHYHRAHENRR